MTRCCWSLPHAAKRAAGRDIAGLEKSPIRAVGDVGTARRGFFFLHVHRKGERDAAMGTAGRNIGPADAAERRPPTGQGLMV